MVVRFKQRASNGNKLVMIKDIKEVGKGLSRGINFGELCSIYPQII